MARELRRSDNVFEIELSRIRPTVARSNGAEVIPQTIVLWIRK